MQLVLDNTHLEHLIIHLANPTAVKAQYLDPTNVNPDPITPHLPNWQDLSLANGYPSLLLFFSVLQKLGLVSDGDAIVHRYVLKIKETIETQNIFDLSLFSGVTGICFALQQASCEGTRYQKMLQTLNTFLLNQVEEAYLAPLRENRRQGLPTNSRLYDPIQGVCGIGRYALDNLSSPPLLTLAQQIARSLVEFLQPIRYEGVIIPGWVLTPQDPINAQNALTCSKGNFNLGLAHGIPGVLAFLAIASLHGVEVPGQYEAIETLSNWIRQKSFMGKNGIAWGYNVPWEVEVENQQIAQQPTRDAWCYGAPGIARTLFLASKATDDAELKQFAATAFRDIFRRSQKEWDLPGPSLCHGISGLLLITHEMAQEEGCEDLAFKIEELKTLLLTYSRPEAPWGFKDVELCRFGKFCEINKPGFLEGASGVLLTLLSLENPTLKWHAPLLIHV
jgi:hypothetical protein